MTRTCHEREKDGEPTEHVARCSLRVNREADITVEDRLEVASKSMTDSGARDVEREVSRTSVMMICVREACVQ